MNGWAGPPPPNPLLLHAGGGGNKEIDRATVLGGDIREPCPVGRKAGNYFPVADGVAAREPGAFAPGAFWAEVGLLPSGALVEGAGLEEGSEVVAGSDALQPIPRKTSAARQARVKACG